MAGTLERPRVVVEVGRRGKLVVGEPYFTPGRSDRARREGVRRRSSAGDLAVVRPGRGRARVERGLGQREADRERARGAARRAAARGSSSSRTTLREPSLDGRVDLRDLTTFTIDPETAKDFDDALSFRREAGRDPRVGAHRRRLVLRPGRDAARPRRRGARVLDLRAGARRADAAARARRRRLLAPAAPGPALRDRRDAAAAASRSFYRSVIRSRRAAHLRPGGAARGAAGDRRAARARRRGRDGAPPAALRARRARR